MNSIDNLAVKLQPHYTHFDVENRLLFTGHSHQAWPDVAAEGLMESYRFAAAQVDKKWETAFEKTETLRSYLRNYYDDPNGRYCLGQNTHQLLVSWLSSFDLKNRPEIVTTDAEFHSMYRQLHRLKEEGLHVHRIDADPDGIVDRIERYAGKKTAAIMLSRVYFESGLINLHLADIADLARSRNIPLLIDDYHGTNVVPLSLREENLEDCYLLIGGYKYLQWGEGNCFLRYPADCELRPAVTGWFAAFDSLEEPRRDQSVAFDKGNRRFASGTYDPASQFRAAAVVRFFREQKLTPPVLRRQYQEQVTLLKKHFLEQQFDPGIIKLHHDRPPEENGGFLALQSPFARTIRAKLLEQDVYTDARGDILRIGPAPYITTSQIEEAVQKLKEVTDRLEP